jgi:hypothetical protein
MQLTKQKEKNMNVSENHTSRNDDLIDKMDLHIDENKIKQTVKASVAEFADCSYEEQWAYNANMNLSGYCNYWYSNMNWIQTQYDKTIDQLQNAYAGETITEISNENIDKLIFKKKAQECSLERASIYYHAYVNEYEKIFETKYQPYSNKKSTVKDVTKEYKLEKLKEALSSVRK